MFISNITCTNCILYVSEIAKVWYTLTWCWPFDRDGISSFFEGSPICSMIEKVVYFVIWKMLYYIVPYSLNEIKQFEFDFIIKDPCVFFFYVRVSCNIHVGKSVKYSGTLLWNQLKYNVKNSPNFNIFKKQLVTFYAVYERQLNDKLNWCVYAY